MLSFLMLNAMLASAPASKMSLARIERTLTPTRGRKSLRRKCDMARGFDGFDGIDGMLVMLS